MNYYCLIAGLPDLQLNDTKRAPNLMEFVAELKEELSREDRELLSLLLLKYDNANLLAFIKNKEANLNPQGQYSSEDWHSLVKHLEEEEPLKGIKFPSYIMEFFKIILDETAPYSGSKEDLLASLYYEYGRNSKNAFVASWFEFNLNVNNILSALTCRKYGFDIKQAVIGENEIAHILRSSNARDFGLPGLCSDYDLISKIAEDMDLLEREKRLDALRWNWLEENTFFEYFSGERVLAYYIKCELLDRWNTLSVEKGKEIFRNLLDELKREVNFDN